MTSFSFLLTGIFFCTAFASGLVAQTDSIRYTQGTWVITPYFAYGSCSSYFQADGQAKTRDHSDSDPNDYVNEYNLFEGGVRLSYAATNDLLLLTELPFAYHRVREYYLASGAFEPVERNRYSATGISHYAVGMEYVIARRRSATSLFLDLRSAPVLSPRSDSLGYYPFMPDGAMSIGGGIRSRAVLGTTRLSAMVGYMHRTALLRDQLNIKAAVEFAAIPGTSLRLTGELLQNVGSMKNLSFSTQRMPFAESYMALGAGFTTVLDEFLIANAEYDIRISGANSWALGRIMLSCGFILH